MTCQAGCVKLQTKILEHWDPQTYNAGCFNPNSFYDGTRTPSDHARGEAFDVGIEVPYRGKTSTGQVIFEWLYASRRVLGLVQIIWSGQIWDARNGHGDGIRPYTANLHLDHIHVSMNSVAARNALQPIPPFPGEAPAPAPAAPGPASGPHTNPTLKKGSHGPVVVVLQALLNNKLGRRLTTDGNFGPATDAAVRLFQSNIRAYFHLPTFAVDGVVGPATWYWLAK